MKDEMGEDVETVIDESIIEKFNSIGCTSFWLSADELQELIGNGDSNE